MTSLLEPALRVAGAGMIALALLHVPIARRLGWQEDARRMSPVNAAVFRVHAFFICLVLVGMGLPCLVEPGVFLERSRAGAWASWGGAAFWGARWWCQWFVYPAELWRGKPLETRLHRVFTALWIALTAVFTLCGLRQAGWLPP